MHRWGKDIIVHIISYHIILYHIISYHNIYIYYGESFYIKNKNNTIDIHRCFMEKKTLVNLKCRYCLKSIYIVTDGTEKCNKWWCWFRSASVQMASNLMWCPIASVCQRSWGVLSIWAPSVGDRFPIQGWGQHGSTGNRSIWSSPAASWLVQQALRVGASTGFFWLCRSLLGTPLKPPSGWLWSSADLLTQSW